MPVYFTQSSRSVKHRRALVCLLGALLPWTVSSAAPATFIHKGADGVTVFSDTPVKNGELTRQSYRINTRPVVAANPCRGLTSTQLDARANALEPEFRKAAREHTVDAALLKAVARAESCFDPRAVSRVGATGLMQLMPITAQEMGVSDVYDQIQNLNGGAKYLARMLTRYSSDTRLALAAYNAGPGNVDRYQGVPPFDETRRYIETVLRLQKHYAARPAQL